jgi:hypothetical protein
MVHCGFEPTAVIDTALHPLKGLAVFLRRLIHRPPASRK